MTRVYNKVSFVQTMDGCRQVWVSAPETELCVWSLARHYEPMFSVTKFEITASIHRLFFVSRFILLCVDFVELVFFAIFILIICFYVVFLLLVKFCWKINRTDITVQTKSKRENEWSGKMSKKIGHKRYPNNERYFTKG